MKFSAKDAAEWCGGRIEDSHAGEPAFEGMETMDRAGPAQLTFIGKAVYGRRLAASRAGGALVSEGISVDRRPDQVLIRVPDADVAVAKILEKLAPPLPLPPPGIHPSAVVDPSAQLAAGVRIGPQTVIEADARIGRDSVIMAQCYIGRGVKIGADSMFWPQVVVRDGCEIGSRVVLHPGCVIGADGFGYRFDKGRHLKIPQIGGVVIGDDCELGANTAVDRGKFSNTVIGRGCKLDNLVQVGHNAQLGNHCILVAHVAVGGSVQAGDYLIVGGGSVISDHQTIGVGVQVAGGSAVADDLPDGSRVVGSPARPGKEFFSQMRATNRLPALQQTVRKLEERITELESSAKNHRQ